MFTPKKVSINIIVKRGWMRPVLMLALVSAMLAGCASPAPAPAPTETSAPQQAAVEPTTEPTSEPTTTLLPATATQAPSPVVEPSATPTPASLPAAAVNPDGFQAWCMPEKAAYVQSVSQSEVMPEGGRAGTENQGVMRLQFPVTSCTFVYTFNQKLPDGVELQVFDYLASRPFLKVKLSPSQENPNVGFAFVNHAYIQNPPYWQVSYRFELHGSDDSVLSTNTVTLFKSQVANCFDGSTPDPITLRCPSADYREPEPHPTEAPPALTPPVG